MSPQSLSECFGVITGQPSDGGAAMRYMLQSTLSLMWPLLPTHRQCNLTKLMTCSMTSLREASPSQPHRGFGWSEEEGMGLHKPLNPLPTSLEDKLNGFFFESLKMWCLLKLFIVLKPLQVIRELWSMRMEGNKSETSLAYWNVYRLFSYIVDHNVNKCYCHVIPNQISPVIICFFTQKSAADSSNGHSRNTIFFEV